MMNPATSPSLERNGSHIVMMPITSLPASGPGPYYINCVRKRDRVYIFAYNVLVVAALFGFVISLNYLNGFFRQETCFGAAAGSSCISYNGDTYQYSSTPGIFYAMLALTFGPLALVILAFFIFWFFKPPVTE